MSVLQRRSAAESESGFVMFAVLIALVVVASIGLMLTTESAMEADRTGRENEAREADYLAQAALQHALWQNAANVCAGDFSLPSTPLGAHSYSATATGGGSTTAYSLSADQDAWIRSDVPDNNNNSASHHIRFEGGNIEQALYRYDLSSLPAGAQINSATAWLFLKSGNDHPEGPIRIHAVTTDWTETGVTWETLNGGYDRSALDMIPAQELGGVWVQINLTAQTQAWVNGQPNYGILFDSTAEGIHTEYVSREGAAGEQPRLEVIVGTVPASPVSITATGTLANGNTRTLSRPSLPAYQPSSTAVLQLGTDPGEDAMLDSFYDARNYGGADYMQVHDSGTDWQQYPLLRFDLSALPPGAAVRSARLELNLQSLNAPGTATIHQVSRSWVEGTRAGGGTADGATWFTHDGTNSWTSAGGDFNASVVATTAINGGETWVSWEIGPLVERWLAGAPNYGLMIRPDGALQQAKFASREDADTTVHPRLTIEYSCACGSACMTPQGSGTILMSVVNPTTLVPADAWKKALFESWGYTVSVISESANQSSYDAAVVTSDVAFISETVNSNSVGSKLASAAIGVVSQDGDYNSDLGFASGSSWSVSPELTVTDSGHYITQVFASGPLDIYSGSMEQLTVSGTQATGLTTLAETGGAGSLTALEQGATMSTGGSAAGRRVMLPFGRESSLSWQYLNGNGLVMLQRAIAWAMGADTTGLSGPEILLVSGGNSVVTDTGDGFGYVIVPTAQEQLRISLFESWGYQVSLILPSQDQAAFDAALTTSAVVFVSGEADASQIGTKLTATSVGVVNGQIALHDELGFSSSAGTNDFDKIVIENNSHSITDGFSTGFLTVTTSSQTLQALDGTLAPDLQTLATAWITGANYKDALALLDTGAALYAGGIAAGRRAQLPWGSASFDFNALNDNGRTILQRTLEWAAGLEAAPAGPIAHWKLDDGTGFTAVDSIGGHDGDLLNGPSWDAVGQIDGALRFPGNDDYVNVPHDDALSLTNMTISLWLKTPALNNVYQTMVRKKQQANYQLTTWSDEIVFAFNDGTGMKLFQTTNANLTTNEWHHVAATLDDATGDINIYVDGVSIFADTTPFRPLPNTDPLTIGGVPDGSTYWPGMLDDIRLYDRVLSATEISSLAKAGGDSGGGGGGGGGPGYVELHEPWSAGSADTWQTVSLASFGVPADAVVEVAAINSWAGAEYWGGVRAVGSSLERRFLLHEAEGGGNDVVTMHVQANGSSEIQHYSDNTARVSFILLGYWTGASYVELFEPFKAGANASWREHNLGTYGVGPDQVAEIVMSQTSTSIEWLVGARHSGSSLQRRVSLHEAEGGGVDAVTMQVETDASSIVEVYAGANSVVDFHLIGYWSTPPGTYTETGGVHGQATASSTWQQANLATFGIPANSVAQFIVSNEVFNFERELGVRRVGSTLNRLIDLQEAEDGGADTASLHVNVDGSSQIEWYSADGTADRYFYPIGWWVLN